MSGVPVFKSFVQRYRNKLDINEDPYTPEMVASETGLNLSGIYKIFAFWNQYPSYTDDQIIALDPTVVQTPFGIDLVPKSATRSDSDPGETILSTATFSQLASYLATKFPNLTKS